MWKKDYTKRTKELFEISMPMAFEQVFITLMGIVSTVMVSSVGDFAVSAVSMVDAVSNLLIALFAALTTGGTIVVAQYKGKGDINKATNAGAQALLLGAIFALFISIIFFAFYKGIINLLFNGAEEAVIMSAIDFLFLVNFLFRYWLFCKRFLVY